MRGIKIRKNILLLSVIASLLATTFAMASVSGQSPATLAAPTIVNLDLGPGDSFYVDITVDDVSEFWGYMFTLSYNPKILTAVSAEPWPGPPPVWFPPFYQPLPSKIDEEAGIVQLAAGTWYGDPEGVTTTEPIAVARITFTIDLSGISPLDLSDTVLVDIHGELIPHDVVDGSFRNIPSPPPGVRVADLADWCAKIEHHNWRTAKDADNTLKGRVINLGDIEINAMVVFTVTDEEGLWTDEFETPVGAVQPGTTLDLTYDLTLAELNGLGKYYVSAQCYYDYDGDGHVETPGATIKFHGLKFRAG